MGLLIKESAQEKALPETCKRVSLVLQQNWRQRQEHFSCLHLFLVANFEDKKFVNRRQDKNILSLVWTTLSCLVSSYPFFSCRHEKRGEWMKIATWQAFLSPVWTRHKSSIAPFLKEPMIGGRYFFGKITLNPSLNQKIAFASVFVLAGIKRIWKCILITISKTDQKPWSNKVFPWPRATLAIITETNLPAYNWLYGKP